MGRPEGDVQAWSIKRYRPHLEELRWRGRGHLSSSVIRPNGATCIVRIAWWWSLVVVIIERILGFYRTREPRSRSQCRSGVGLVHLQLVAR